MENNATVIENDTQTIVIEKPKQEVMTGYANKQIALVRGLQIDSPEMADYASQFLAKIKEAHKRLDAQRTTITKPLLDAQRATNAMFKGPMEELEQAEKELKDKISLYLTEQRRREAIERAKADEQARIEREKIEAEARAKEAEAAKIAAEAQAQAEAAERARQAELDAQKAGDHAAAERARLEAEAAEQARMTALAQEQTAQVEAQAIALTAAVTTVVPVAVSSKVAGVSTSAPWKARVVDKAALLEHIAKNPELLDWVEVKMTGPNGMAKALKDNLRIPGIEAYQDITISSRGSK